MPKKFKLYIALTTIFSLILIEASVRALGFVDFPVYDLDDEIKYIPSANQSGRFMNENDWYFNNKSMPIRENWSPAGDKNILLIGNSIVMGGNPYKQSDKLVSQIQVRLSNDNKVWPIAVGGWNQPNEIAYLRLHPEIVSRSRLCCMGIHVLAVSPALRLGGGSMCFRLTSRPTRLGMFFVAMFCRGFCRLIQ